MQRGLRAAGGHLSADSGPSATASPAAQVTNAAPTHVTGRPAQSGAAGQTHSSSTKATRQFLILWRTNSNRKCNLKCVNRTPESTPPDAYICLTNYQVAALYVKHPNSYAFAAWRPVKLSTSLSGTLCPGLHLDHLQNEPRSPGRAILAPRPVVLAAGLVPPARASLQSHVLR